MINGILSPAEEIIGRDLAFRIIRDSLIKRGSFDRILNVDTLFPDNDFWDVVSVNPEEIALLWDGVTLTGIWDSMRWIIPFTSRQVREIKKFIS